MPEQAETKTPRNAAVNDNKLKIVVIGGGSAAFACAIRAAEEGARVTMIEAGTVGGTCVNIGCVPSKILIRAAHVAHMQEAHPFVGITRTSPVIDRAALAAQQQARVEELRRVKYESILETSPAINLLKGRARFQDAHTLVIKRPDGSEKTVHADRILIATGARPTVPDIPGLKDTPFWTSTEALAAESLPKHLVVLGGSVTAVELAQAFRRLGSDVTVLARSTLLSKEDAAIGEELQAIFEDEGIRVLTHTLPNRVQYENDEFILETPKKEVRGDRLLVAAGRRPNTQALALERRA